MILNNGKYKESKISKGVSLKDGNGLIPVTGHRKGSFGRDFENICEAIKKIVKLNENVEIVYPVSLRDQDPEFFQQTRHPQMRNRRQPSRKEWRDLLKMLDQVTR